MTIGRRALQASQQNIGTSLNNKRPRNSIILTTQSIIAPSCCFTTLQSERYHPSSRFLCSSAFVGARHRDNTRGHCNGVIAATSSNATRLNQQTFFASASFVNGRIQQIRWKHSSDSSKSTTTTTPSTTADGSSDTKYNSKYNIVASVASATASTAQPTVSTTPISTSSPNPSSLPEPLSNDSTISTSKQKRKRRHKSFSPLIQITDNHPKNANLPTILLPTNGNHPSMTNDTSTTRLLPILTRKQILRLTPKQRLQYKTQLHEQLHPTSQLDQVRTNVRSNISYLSSTMDGNFKKNVKTIQRLFKGEEVWKDGEGGSAPSASTAKGGGKKREDDGLATIDLERLPSEIKSNLQSNLSTAQNFLHRATNGMIPSSSYIDPATAAANGGGGDGGGIETNTINARLQSFHKAKESQYLVMDTQWFIYNIAIALLPGTCIALYCLWMQEEMIEFYTNMERKEREKILGVEAEYGGELGGSRNGGDASGGGGGMGISSALISEGGSVIDKLKMTINDLFLGGMEERGLEQNTSQTNDQGEIAREASLEETKHQPSLRSASTTNTIRGGNKNNNEEDSIQMLIERIQSLEMQLGAKQEQSHLTKEEIAEQDRERKQKEHEMNYQIQRIRQSPIRNRREDKLKKQWLREKEETSKIKKEEALKDDAVVIDGKEALGSSPSFVGFVTGIVTMMEKDITSTKEKAMKQINAITESACNFKLFEIEEATTDATLSTRDETLGKQDTEVVAVDSENIASTVHNTLEVRKPETEAGTSQSIPSIKENSVRKETSTSGGRSLWNPRNWFVGIRRKNGETKDISDCNHDDLYRKSNDEINVDKEEPHSSGER